MWFCSSFYMCRALYWYRKSVCVSTFWMAELFSRSSFVETKKYSPRTTTSPWNFGSKWPTHSWRQRDLPRLRTKFGECAFSHAGPSTWNTLPDNIRTVSDPVKFRKLLKSHYFNTAFNICWLLSAFISFWLVMHLWSSCNRRTINNRWWWWRWWW